jgi:hypothetical protein
MLTGSTTSKGPLLPKIPPTLATIGTLGFDFDKGPSTGNKLAVVDDEQPCKKLLMRANISNLVRNFHTPNREFSLSCNEFQFKLNISLSHTYSIVKFGSFLGSSCLVALCPNLSISLAYQCRQLFWRLIFKNTMLWPNRYGFPALHKNLSTWGWNRASLPLGNPKSGFPAHAKTHRH